MLLSITCIAFSSTEIVSGRDFFKKTYHNSGNNYSTEISINPVHYLNNNNEFVEIPQNTPATDSLTALAFKQFESRKTEHEFTWINGMQYTKRGNSSGPYQYFQQNLNNPRIGKFLPTEYPPQTYRSIMELWSIGGRQLVPNYDWDDGDAINISDIRFQLSCQEANSPQSLKLYKLFNENFVDENGDAEIIYEQLTQPAHSTQIGTIPWSNGYNTSTINNNINGANLNLNPFYIDENTCGGKMVLTMPVSEEGTTASNFRVNNFIATITYNWVPADPVVRVDAWGATMIQAKDQSGNVVSYVSTPDMNGIFHLSVPNLMIGTIEAVGNNNYQFSPASLPFGPYDELENNPHDTFTFTQVPASHVSLPLTKDPRSSNTVYYQIYDPQTFLIYGEGQKTFTQNIYLCPQRPQTLPVGWTARLRVFTINDEFDELSFDITFTSAFGSNINLPNSSFNHNPTKTASVPTALYPDIQTALDRIKDGGTVTLNNQTFTGPRNINLSIGNKSLFVKSANPALACNINGNGTGNGLTLINSNSVIKGITFQNFFMTSPNVNKLSPIKILNCSPKIWYCKFLNNENFPQGGGINIENGSPEITNCIFNFNKAVQGGAIYAIGTSKPIMKDNSFEGNWVQKIGTTWEPKGGAILIDGSANIDLKNSTFLHNYAPKSPTNGFDGGAIYLTNPTTSVIDNCVFNNNWSSFRGGAIYVETVPANTTLKISNNEFKNNLIDHIEMEAGASSFHVRYQLGTSYLYRNTFHDTYQEQTYNYNNNWPVRTGNEYSLQTGILKLVNNSFTDCQGMGDSYCSSLVTAYNPVKFVNNIFSANKSYSVIATDPSLPVTFEYCIFNNIANTNIGSNNVNVTLTNCKQACPPLLDTDLTPSWTTDEYSPCIDAGKPDTDGDGISWKTDFDDMDADGTRADIGAKATVVHQMDSRTLLPQGQNGYINWVSFPSLNTVTDEQMIIHNGLSQIVENVYAFNQMSWLDFDNDFHLAWQTSTDLNLNLNRAQGYKIWLNQSVPIELSGFKLSKDNVIILRAYNDDPNDDPNNELYCNWIGYYLDKAMTPWDAYAPVLDKIDMIKSRYWSTYKNPDGTWTGKNIGIRMLINPGEMVMVHATDPCWLTLGGVGDKFDPTYYPQIRTFTYKEKSDYLPIYTYLELTSKSQPQEVGLYINGICKGAAVIQDSLTQINAYVIGDTIDWDTANVEFVLHYADKSMDNTISSYGVFDYKTKKYFKKSLNLGDKQNYYTVKLGEGNDIELPEMTELAQNYPNPFNPSTTINYTLKSESQVCLEIYNIKGQKVKSLVNQTKPAGFYNIVWNGKDTNNAKCASGIYFLKMKADGKTLTRKMMLIK